MAAAAGFCTRVISQLDWRKVIKSNSGNAYRCAAAAAVFSVSMGALAEQPEKKSEPKSIPLEAATMIIEYNSSAEDIGVQFFLDSEGWREISIFDPNGQEIFDAESEADSPGKVVAQSCSSRVSSRRPPNCQFKGSLRGFPRVTTNFAGATTTETGFTARRSSVMTFPRDPRC
jgi:hypothetical protein